jgi:hypothetical protein
MIEHIGTPRMQDACHPGLDALASRKLGDGAPSRFEHAVVEFLLMRHGHRMKAVGNGEYDVEVFSRYNFFLPRLNPYLTLLVLTFGTMAVATTVVADMQGTARRAYVNMSAKCLGPA